MRASVSACAPPAISLLFEANGTLVVNPPEPGEHWEYRRPAVERIFAAVRRMLTAHIAAAPK
jgi:hypothetical protein